MNLLSYDTLIQIPVSMTLSACFAILFRAPRKYFPYTVGVGFISSQLNYFLSVFHSQLISVALTAFLVGIISQGLARRTSSPSQGFIIPGIIILVPGIQIIKSLEQLRLGDHAGLQGSIYSALAVSLTISFSILMANWLVPSHREL